MKQIHIWRHISNADYDRLFKEQKGLCAICKKPDPKGRKLSVDHDHSTNEVRGLLCFHCNSALGNFYDDKSLLQSAIGYLGRVTGLYLSKTPIRNEKRQDKVHDRNDWRRLDITEREKVANMHYRDIMKIYKISRSTAFEWKTRLRE